MIVLASASPRRRELLKLIAPEFECEDSGVDESCDITDPKALVSELAYRKAISVFERRPEDTVIGADTIVCCDGQILEKPNDTEDALRMITLLAGNTHTVYTGVCVMRKDGVKTAVGKTRVTFTPMSRTEIDAYVKSADIMDKAGAYAVQGEAAKYIEKIDGCFYNVMGLPLNLLYSMLKSLA